jgi:hypothetical protein
MKRHYPVRYTFIENLSKNAQLERDGQAFPLRRTG